MADNVLLENGIEDFVFDGPFESYATTAVESTSTAQGELYLQPNHPTFKFHDGEYTVLQTSATSHVAYPQQQLIPYGVPEFPQHFAEQIELVDFDTGLKDDHFPFDDMEDSETYSYGTSPSSPLAADLQAQASAGYFGEHDFQEKTKVQEGFVMSAQVATSEIVAPVSSAAARRTTSRKRSPKVRSEMLDSSCLSDADEDRKTKTSSTSKRRRVTKKQEVQLATPAISPAASPSHSQDEAQRKEQIQEFFEKVKRSNNLTKEKKKKQSKEQFKCTFPGCERTFVWGWARDEHAATHMPEDGRDYPCTYCDKSFFTPGCLKSHIRIHTRKPYSYVCQVEGCTKKYCTSEGLRLHKRNVHESDKRWKCPTEDCGKSFVRQSDLRLHIIRIHFSERPYPCTVENCKKSFACYSELRRHLPCHAAEK